MTMRDSHFDLPNVGEMPHQPGWNSFPKRAFGKTKVSSRAFHGPCFAKWKWLLPPHAMIGTPTTTIVTIIDGK